MAQPSQSIPNVKHIIAVASGKGGVGKSTVAMNLAVALSVSGKRVGLLDADIYGPSQPRMMALTDEAQKPQSDDGKRITPAANHGVKVMSMGFMVEEDTPLIWRGPMALSALKQMLFDVAWGSEKAPLDVLVLDMPPGTGDIQLSMAQQVPLSGAVVVSTPQDIALLDARKGMVMFEKVNVPILGLVENMAGFCCPKCGEVTDIFGKGGVDKAAADLKAEVLARIPLTLDVRENTDVGRPVVLAAPDSDATAVFRALAEKVVAKLATEFKPTSVKIVMEG